MWIRHILGIITFLLCSGCSFFSEKRDDVLIVGTSADCPPYEFVSDSGEIEGYDIEVAKLLASRMGKCLEIKNMSFDTLILALQQNKVDLILSAFSITPDRKKEIALIPYTETDIREVPLLFWKHIPADIKTIGDLEKYHPIIAVQAGTFHESLLNTYPFITVRSLDTILNVLLDVHYGKSMAAIVDPAVAATIKEKYPEIKELIVPIQAGLDVGALGIGIKKENTSLITDVRDIIDQLKNDGTLRIVFKFQGEKKHD